MRDCGFGWRGRGIAPLAAWVVPLQAKRNWYRLCALAVPAVLVVSSE
jgi:hypothetical protein